MPSAECLQPIQQVAGIKHTAAPANLQRAAPILAEGHVTWLARSATPSKSHADDGQMQQPEGRLLMDSGPTTGDLAPVGRKKKATST
ncbi:hypothetical protein RirG_032010 [Rhizophagus irregularis DAOM 197198w]|uniref:Uncharacterized protein n=1 Tax=Rhizophagus irregularis (strain DAOM 197198w) TaxID=1432141 RepID=A0A015K465_RHIIW|nr:hypothetical protein RirG_032010 [Rhizophagus irregularis DAOM 197198w]